MIIGLTFTRRPPFALSLPRRLSLRVAAALLCICAMGAWPAQAKAQTIAKAQTAAKKTQKAKKKGLRAKSEIPFTAAEVDILVKALASHWPAKRVKRLFGRNGVKKISNMIEMNVTKPIQLRTDRYAHFYNRSSLNKAVRFKKKWRTQLARAEATYGVDKNVIVAILWVETRFGQFTGKKNVLSVFSSVYVDCEQLLAKPPAELTDKMLARVTKKRDWALEQLHALFGLRNDGKIKAFALKGSYAGAFGMPQFLPTSYVRWAVEAPRTGHTAYPDLFWEPDAIFSVGNYLKSHGFGIGNLDEVNRKAVWYYNHSGVYVDTIMAVAEGIKKR